jgi:hypothetical protein
VISHEPTPAFVAALEAAGITVRGWEIPRYRFSKRRTFTNALKTDRGGIDLTTAKSGDLRVTIDGGRSDDIEVCQRAHNVTCKLGKQQALMSRLAA